MENARRKSHEGMALLIVTMFIGIAIITLTTLGARLVNQDRQVELYVNFESCTYGMETGLAQSKANLEAGESGMVGIVEGEEGETGELPTFESPQVSPLAVRGMPDVDYFAYHVDWFNDGIDNNGDGVVDGPEERWFHTIYPAARMNGTVRCAEVVLNGEDINVWRNAIFAGGGQAGGLINGNVSIHGSVHLLGDNLLAGGEAISALDLSGASLIHNNYEGAPAELLARVPPLPTREFDDDTVQTLNATLRVKKGLVGISGNSEIGQPHETGNDFKETMDGVFVTDGWDGTAVIDDGDRGDPKSVYSDNGWDEEYDLGDRVPLPLFDNDWREPDTGEKQWDNSRGEYYSHEHYFDEVLVAAPDDPGDGIYEGNIVISAGQDFYYNATRPDDADPANRQPTDDYMLFDEGTNVMEVNGNITINGNLTMTRGGGNDKTIHYTGRAAILVHGNVTLDTDLLTVNADGTTDRSFPENNILGIMAENDMVVGTLSQLQLMGAFYAQNQLSCSKQTTVMGTFVSNLFNMGSQVPDIFQVPALVDYLPRGMIGAYPILCYFQVSWRELGTA